MEKVAINVAIKSKILKLPKKIIEHKNNDALAECILYELSDELCLSLKKIAYFVYNPDFHLCKGIAGVSREDLPDFKENPWENIQDFSKSIKNTDFNKKVLETSFCTVSHDSISLIIKDLKNSLNNQNFSVHSWERTYKNIGILLYEPLSENFESQEEIEDAAGILSFCPIGY